MVAGVAPFWALRTFCFHDDASADGEYVEDGGDLDRHRCRSVPRLAIAARHIAGVWRRAARDRLRSGHRGRVFIAEALSDMGVCRRHGPGDCTDWRGAVAVRPQSLHSI